jgi:NitT/TauT family transport system substrate-binding protein
LAGAVIAACSSSSSGSSAAGGASDAGAQLTNVRLAFTPGATTLPVELALTKGFFKQHGLNVKDTQGLDLPTWAAGLGKQWDIAMETPGIFVAAANKLDLVVVGSGQINSANSWGNPVVTADPNIKKPCDLVGKTVGVATLTGSTPSGLQYSVTHGGCDWSKVKLVQVPFTSESDQLKSGQVNAVVSSPPFSNVLLQNPSYHQLWDAQYEALHTIAPSEPVTASIVYTSTRKWAEAHPQAVTAFQTSLQQAITWENANKAAAQQEMASWLKLPLNVIQSLAWPLPVQATITKAQLQPVVDLYVATGVLTKAAAPNLDNRFPGQS